MQSLLLLTGLLFSADLNLPIITPLSTDFSITYVTSGGFPNFPDLEGNICLQEEVVSFTPRLIERTMRCSPYSSASPNAVIHHTSLSPSLDLLDGLIASVNSFLLSGAKSPVTSNSSAQDDWLVGIEIKGAGISTLTFSLRHNPAIGASLGKLISFVENTTKTHLKFPAERK